MKSGTGNSRKTSLNSRNAGNRGASNTGSCNASATAPCGQVPNCCKRLSTLSRAAWARCG